MSLRVQRLTARVFAHLCLVAGGVVVLFPLLWMISTSLKPADALFTYPPEWLPHPAVWRNYVQAWTVMPVLHWLLNTAYITLLAMPAEVATAAVVAYGFARFRFPGRDALFVVMLATMMLPGIVTLVPSFIIWRWLHLIDTYDPLTIGAWFAWGPSYIFILRQFLLTIPREMEEAAALDGANVVQSFWHVLLPLIRPALLAIAILSFQGNWNNLQGPLIYLNTMQKFPLIIGLKFFEQSLSKEAPLWNYMMAMSVVMAAPILALFFAAQRYFIEGINLGGIKG